MKDMMETIDAIKVPCAYDMSTREWLAILEAADQLPGEASSLAFRFGFLKGQRAERAAQKKKRTKRAEVAV